MRAIPRFSPGFAGPECTRAGRALLAGKIVRGGGDERFAADLAAYLGVRHALLVPSARMGLWLALRASGREPGEVIFPGLTYYAMPAAARLAGFTPRFVDVDEHLLLDIEALAGAINDRTRAIVPTHLYGRAMDMPRLQSLLAGRDLLLVEDIAQGLGAKWDGRKVGTFGDLAVATFGPTKNITALGGACLFTNDDALAERLRRALVAVAPAAAGATLRALLFAAAMALATRGWFFRGLVAPLLKLGRRRGVDLIARATADPPRDFPEIPAGFFHGGVGHLMGEVGAASLAAMDARNARRRENGLRLSAALAGTPGLAVPRPRSEEEPIFMSFPALADDPEGLADALLRRGVDTARGYMSACADLPMFASADRCPHARAAVERMLHLPVHPDLTTGQIDELAQTVRETMAERATK